MNPNDLPSAVTEKVSVALYGSQEFFLQEIEHVWRKEWINVGRADSIPNPGDYFVRELYAIGPSVLVVRGKDHKIRAFKNVCLHRGNTVELDCAGNKLAFACLFHGWVYDTQGALVAVPMENKFAALDRSTLGLIAVHVDIWGGFIHINLAEKPARTLQESLSVLPKALDAWLSKTWHCSSAYEALLYANWKLIVDAQAEGYHVQALHAKTIRGNLPTEKYSDPECFPDDSGVLGKFSIYFADKAPDASPVQLLGAKVGNQSVYVKSELTDPSRLARDAFNLEERPDWCFDVYQILPGIVLFVMGNQIAIQRSWPLAAGKTLWEMQNYVLDQPVNFGDQFNFAVGQCNLRDVVSEDLSTVEATQANMNAGAINEIVLSRMESVVAQQLRRVAKMSGYTVNGTKVST